MNKTAIALIIGLALPLSALAAPVITLVGGSVVLTTGTSYSEPGYSASDSVDGNLTSSVSVSNPVNVNQAGEYTIGYSVFNSLLEQGTNSRQVTVQGGGAANPCVWNGTCPCPTADPLFGDNSGWRACVIAKYPKNIDGSTRVCRLAPVMPGESYKCAIEQFGFGVEDIR